jgi:hypothetical protein
MKIFIYILIVFAIALIGYNATMLDFQNLLTEKSKIALISIVASVCAILLLWLLLISKKITEKK